MSRKLKAILDTHSPEEHYVINDTVYAIILQAGGKEYAIKVFAPEADNYWLKLPESRYETLGGARLAILMHLDTK